MKNNDKKTHYDSIVASNSKISILISMICFVFLLFMVGKSCLDAYIDKKLFAPHIKNATMHPC